jgi:hypothetical protein
MVSAIGDAVQMKLYLSHAAIGDLQANVADAADLDSEHDVNDAVPGPAIQ